MISSLRRFHFYRVVAALLLAGPIAPGLAQSAKDWKCTGSPDIPPDQQNMDCTKAIASDFDGAIRLDPKSALAHNNRGSAYAVKGDFDRAIIDFSEAIRLDPKYSRAYNNRGNAYRDKGDYDRAIADYNEAIRLDPKFAHAYYNRGLAYFSKGDYGRIIYRYGNSLAQARSDFKQAADLSPKDVYAALWLDMAERRSNLPSHLAEAAKRLDMSAWPAPLVRLFLGEATPAAVLSAVDHSDPIKKKGQVCEANFYGAEYALLQNKKDEALRLYRLAAIDCPLTYVEAGAAKAALASGPK